MFAMEPIWGRPEAAAYGPRPAHSRDAVAGAGVRIADAEGIAAVSMRRVAAELNAGTTSLYRYLKSKDELLDLMVDKVLREDEPPGPSGAWKADLRVLAEHARAMMLERPWLAEAMMARPRIGPGALRWSEAWLSIVGDRGRDADEMLTVASTVMKFVFGAVMWELSERGAGYDPQSWMDAQGAYGDAIIAGGRYPHLIRTMVEAEGPHSADRHQRSFSQGMEHLLNGLEAA